ncbi:WXG100 family type VII secretion target [Amycolatopsis regifaucium]|uniref:Endo-1,4-beta-glucanase n=1 Tax=Amycolatopsis regifaucium TaxID=546365 RepID=A0A154MES0_9PSEU|nr:WXG100 family type VII secretion target [Amycolatopsis regifaucium]KZB82079.1 endo-1,4-beta-glucanase [Amycolatopsis regifaucium]OKA05849.1 endo-1,4-beta-glucanase [Amycolatopsis regifaucium]SFG81910.1 Proteins of 100 residues with WXG [Amycolatopsis regifaucium]
MIAESENPTDSIPHPMAAARPAAPVAPQSAFSPLNATGSGETGSGEDGLVEAAAPHLAFLAELSGHLGLIDPVEAYLTPLAARWEDLKDEADRLRKAAKTAGTVSKELSEDLGRLDAGWSGKDADAFVAYIRDIHVAGTDVEDALTTLAGSLDELVLSIRRILTDLVEVLVDTAELTSETAMLPVGGVRRARTQLEEAQESAKALSEAARDVLEGFVRFCDGVDDPDAASRSIEIAHRFPQEEFKLHDEAPAGAPVPEKNASDGAAAGAPDSEEQSTSPSAADPGEGRKTGSQDPLIEQGQAPIPEVAPVQASPAPGQAAAGAGTAMMPMGMAPMGMGMGGGGRTAHQSKTRPASKPSDVVGEPGQVVPPVIGEDDTPAKPGPKPKPAK